MFCPQCGTTQPDDLNYCKSCGAHLQSVRTALVSGAGGDTFDVRKTWVADMFMSSEEKIRREAEIERLPMSEVKRRREIKAGVITLASGVSLTVVLSVILEAVVINGHLSALAADILSRVWIVGLIPVLVGLALIFNGVFISKKGMGAAIGSEPGDVSNELPAAANTNELPPAAAFSVTENTTRHLNEPRKRDP